MLYRLTCILIVAVGVGVALPRCGPTPSSEPRQEYSGPDAAREAELPERSLEGQPEPALEKASCRWASPGPLKITQGGLLVLPDETEPPGGSIALVKRPVGWEAWGDAKQKKIWLRADYKAAGTVHIDIEARCEGLRYTSSVAIEVKALSWRSAPTWKAGVDGPLQREHPRIWWDAKDPDTLWLWGGLVFVPRQFTPAYDLWKWHAPTGTWSQVKATGGPELTTAQIASVPGKQAILVYGGDHKGKTSQDVYTLDYGSEPPTWSKRPQDGFGPGASMLGSLLYDAPRKRYIAACGFQQYLSYLIHCRVSAYTPDAAEGKRWQELRPAAPQPTGRYGFAYAHDAARQRLLLFSGGQQPISNQDPVRPAKDAWSLKLDASPPQWRRIEAKGQVAPGRRNGCFALDPEGQRLFLFGGTANARASVPGLYALHLDQGRERWHLVQTDNPPVIRSSCIGIYDPKRKQILFGFGNDKGIYADLHGLQLAP